ncbi:PapD-like protein [Chlamydoabsidia padenii]|nr:PapD-like protein [Chlamydoabsidia padenii]
MSLIIEPSDLLTFQRPLTNVTKEILLVKNPNAEPAIFKVKTTAPKQYCVRPNAGRIEGNGQVEVQVILQPFKTEPPLDFKCKDKFLVQSALIQTHEYDSTPITDIWTRIETQDQGSIRQHKIKCSFVSAPAQENTTTTNATETHSSQPLESNPTDSAHDVSASHGTKEDDPSTTTNSTIDTLGSSTLPVEDIPTKKMTDDPIETTKEQPPAVTTTQANMEPPTPQTKVEKEPQTIGPVTSTPTTTTRSPPTTENHHPTVPVNIDTPKKEAVKTHQKDVDEKQQLRQALESAQQQINLLQRELEQSKQELDGLRLRQNASRTDSRKLPPTVQPSDAVHQHLAQLQKPHPIEGYPPQVVAIMCGVIFLFTYIFL